MVKISRTRDYHKYHHVDLMTELTICETLGSVKSPHMVALNEPKAYGAIVGDLLVEHGLLKPGCTICEIGGGYGTLMAGLLGSHASLINRAVMMDLSMHLLKKQRAILEPWAVKTDFIQADAHDFLPIMHNIDLIIINEVIGDFETWKDLDPHNLPKEAGRMVNRYALDIPGTERFNFNMGAISLVEKICRSGIPAFIAEHSSDPIIPAEMTFLEKGLEIDSYPREIQLRDHCEFTIRFSHLLRVAEWWGRTITRGSLIDLVGLKKSPKMKFIFSMRSCASDEHEIIYELLDNIREYQWLLII